MLWPLLTLNSSILSLIWSGTAYFVVNYTNTFLPGDNDRRASWRTCETHFWRQTTSLETQNVHIFPFVNLHDMFLRLQIPFLDGNNECRLYNEKRRTSMAFYIRPTGTQISRGFKVHNVISCESKVQGIVSLGLHWVLTNGTWHVLLQSENVFELRGITIVIFLLRGVNRSTDRRIWKIF